METLELAIQNLNHAGEGLARHAGRVVFVPYALPGEIVRAEIIQAKKGFARARLLEVITPAPERIPPSCRHYFSLDPGRGPARPCGGCQLQHLAYPAQLAFKQSQVAEQLRRVGGLADPPVRPARPAATPWGYRNHLQFALMADGRLAYKAAGSDAAVPIQECPIAEPGLMDLFGRLKFESVPDVQRVSLRAGAEADQRNEKQQPKRAMQRHVRMRGGGWGNDRASRCGTRMVPAGRPTANLGSASDDVQGARSVERSPLHVEAARFAPQAGSVAPRLRRGGAVRWQGSSRGRYPADFGALGA